MSINEKVMVLFPEHRYMKAIQNEIDKGVTHGVVKGDDFDDNEMWLTDPDIAFISRKYAEHCEDYRQVIPYMAITRYKEGKPEVLVYKRKPSKDQVDPRLNRKWSIGIGGHVNINSSIIKEVDPDTHTTDVTLMDAVVENANREFEEELSLINGDINNSEMYATNLIFDNTNAIGRVHIGQGLVLLLGDNKCEFEANEEGIEVIGFKGQEFFEELFKSEEGETESVLETWSLDYVKLLFGLDGHTCEFDKIQKLSTMQLGVSSGN